MHSQAETKVRKGLFKWLYEAVTRRGNPWAYPLSTLVTTPLFGPSRHQHVCVQQHNKGRALCSQPCYPVTRNMHACYTDRGGHTPSLVNSLGSHLLSLGRPSLNDLDTDTILGTHLGHGLVPPVVTKGRRHHSHVYPLYPNPLSMLWMLTILAKCVHSFPLPLWVGIRVVPYLRPSPSMFHSWSSLVLHLPHTPPQVSLMMNDSG